MTEDLARGRQARAALTKASSFQGKSYTLARKAEILPDEATGERKLYYGLVGERSDFWPLRSGEYKLSFVYFAEPHARRSTISDRKAGDAEIWNGMAIRTKCRSSCREVVSFL